MLLMEPTMTGRNPAFSGNSRVHQEDNQEQRGQYQATEQRLSPTETSAAMSSNASLDPEHLSSQISYSSDPSFFNHYGSSAVGLQWPTTSTETYADFTSWPTNQLMSEMSPWGQQFLSGQTSPYASSSIYMSDPSGSTVSTPGLLSGSLQHQPVLGSTSHQAMQDDPRLGARDVLGVDVDQDLESPGNNEPPTNSSGNAGPSRPGRATRIRERTANQPFRSCWRCKRYRKPCDENAVCNSCVMTSGFRVWPSSLGCRRGNLEDCVFLIIPEKHLDSLGSMSQEYVKPFTWRRASHRLEQEQNAQLSDQEEDIYANTIQSVLSTRIHGPGIAELLYAATRFQRKQAKENPGLQLGFTALSLIMSTYHSLVSTEEAEIFDPSIQLVEKFVEIRRALVRFTDRFLLSCLTGRLKSWPTTFLAANIGVIAFVFLADAIVAIPDAARSQVWEDLKQTILDLRRHLHSIAQDLLLALSKGADMLSMSCWNYMNTPANDPAGGQSLQPNNHGFQLMDHDKDVFDLMCELAQWRVNYDNLLRDDTWMSTKPFEIDLPLIKSLSRLFSMAE